MKSCDGAAARRHHFEGPAGRQLPAGEIELENRGARSAAHIQPVALRRESQPQPAIRHADRAHHAGRGDLDRADGGRPVSAIQHQQVLAVRRERRGHGQRVQRNLLAGGLHPPAAVQQKAAARQRSHLLARSGLGNHQPRQREQQNDQPDAGGSRSPASSSCAVLIVQIACRPADADCIIEPRSSNRPGRAGARAGSRRNRPRPASRRTRVRCSCCRRASPPAY